MKCPRCQTDNTSDSKFCRACATPLPVPEIDQVLPTETLEIVPETSISGTIFAGRYKVVEELGRGGMGRVYRAYDNQLREEVALKIIKPEVASDKKALERFSNELKLARKIIHRNVCRLYELMEYQGVRFISMEYVPGEDLKSFIKRARRLDIGAAVAIAIQVCEGLAEAHRLGVVHRDLKPGNIMIDNEGSAKIMDFGIARSLLEKGITGEGRVVGTPEYISPEQIEGKAADRQSDLYALGVILFEMVCGTYPFEGDTSRIIAQKIQGKKPPNPKTINPHIPDDLAKVILKCLEKKERRYQSATDVLTALQKIENDLPTSERIKIKTRSSMFAGITKQIQKRKILGTVIGLVAVALVVILVSRPWRSEPKVPVVPQKPTLAVLFFANRTNDPSLETWEINLCLLFIEALRQSSSLVTVLNAESIYAYHKRLSLDETHFYSSDELKNVASMSHASHIMTGYFMKVGQILRLSYDLKDAVTGATIGSDHRDGKGSQDFNEMVGGLAESVLGKFNISFRGKAESIKASPLALQYYLEARNLEIRLKMSSDMAERKSLSSEMLQKYQMAIRFGPDFAQAYWGLGDVYEGRYADSFNPSDLAEMKNYYEKAYSINPNLAGANAGLGWAKYYEKRPDEAYRFFSSAVEFERDDPKINFNVAEFLSSVGLIEKGIEYFTRAIECGDTTLRPFSRRARSYMDIGKLEDAAADAKIMIGLESQDFAHQRFYARILAMMKRYDEAERELTTTEKVDPGNPEIPLIRTYIYAAKGDKEKAIPIMEKARKENLFKYIYFLSENYALLGMNDEAIDIIRQGLEKGFEKSLDYLYPYPVLNSGFYEKLRVDPRFQEILRNQTDKYVEQLKKYRGL